MVETQNIKALIENQARNTGLERYAIYRLPQSLGDILTAPPRGGSEIDPAPYTQSLRPKGQRITLTHNYNEPRRVSYYERRQWLTKVEKEAAARRSLKMYVPHHAEKIAQEIIKTDICFKSHAGMTHPIGLCEKTAARVCKWLEDVGLITWSNRRTVNKQGKRIQTSNIYTLILTAKDYLNAKIKSRRPTYRERSAGLQALGVSLFKYNNIVSHEARARLDAAKRHSEQRGAEEFEKLRKKQT